MVTHSAQQEIITDIILHMNSVPSCF